MKPNVLRQFTACRLLVFLLFPTGWSLADMQIAPPSSSLLFSPRVIPSCYFDDDTCDGDWREHVTFSSGIAHVIEIIPQPSLRPRCYVVRPRAGYLAVHFDLQTTRHKRAPPHTA